MPPPRPKNADEVQLESTQKAVTLGQLADETRKTVMYRLWSKGMTQREIAERLSRASRAAGGKDITENAVYKLLAIVKREMDAAEVA